MFSLKLNLPGFIYLSSPEVEFTSFIYVFSAWVKVTYFDCFLSGNKLTRFDYVLVIEVKVNKFDLYFLSWIDIFLHTYVTGYDKIMFARQQFLAGWNLKAIIIAGLILGLHPANERWSYFVTMSLIGWAQP